MGGANTMLPTEGVVLKGVDIGDMRPSHRLEKVALTIHTVWPELSELVGRGSYTICYCSAPLRTEVRL